jgi:hypothetical protein
VASKAIVQQPAACTIDSSGHSPAKVRMYSRLRGLNPSTPGNSAPRSFASRSMTFVPQPSACSRFRMSTADRPVQQNELAVDGKRGAHLGGVDALLDVFEEGSIARRGLERLWLSSSLGLDTGELSCPVMAGRRLSRRVQFAYDSVPRHLCSGLLHNSGGQIGEFGLIPHGSARRPLGCNFAPFCPQIVPVGRFCRLCRC